MSTRVGDVRPGIGVTVFASADGPRVQLDVRELVVSLTHADVRDLQRLLRRAEKLLVERQREADRRPR